MAVPEARQSIACVKPETASDPASRRNGGNHGEAAGYA